MLTLLRFGPIQIRDRDLIILRGLFETRVMTIEHIAIIYFNGHQEAAKKRIQKLKAARLIAERPRRINEPAVLYIAKQGLLLLREQGVLAEYPVHSLPALVKRAVVSEAIIPHELAVVDVKTAFHSAVRKVQKLSLAEFGTWSQLYEFEISQNSWPAFPAKPDGFIRIHEAMVEGGIFENSFFLEVDRSTETQSILVSHATAYLDYYKSGGFALRNGAPRSAFENYPFRVLFVLKTEERRNNTAERLLQCNPPILTQVYLSTISEVRRNPLGAIWIRPLDYREASKDTIFSFSDQWRRQAYARQTMRDLHVAKTIKKIPLLDSEK